jgi:Ca-activated chloride channel family protein
MYNELKALSLLLSMLAATPAFATSAYKAVQQGNTRYQQEQYDEAAKHYDKAAEQLPDAAEIHFNQGNAAYKQRDYAKALEYYNQALQTADPALESQTKYNLGNVKYQQALQSMAKPQEAVANLKNAMTYYRDSLDVDPKHSSARYNMELAHKLMQQIQQQQQQQKKNDDQQQAKEQNQNQEQNQGQKPKQAQKNQDTQEKQQEQQDLNQQQQSKQRQQEQEEKSDQESQQEQHDKQANADNNPSDEKASPSQADAQNLTPEEAKQLLNAIRERAREANQEREQRRRERMGATQVDKDW